MKGSFRAIWRSLFPKAGQWHKPKNIKRFEIPDTELKPGENRRMAVNRAERRRFAHINWRCREKRNLSNGRRQTVNRKNLNRRRRKIAAASGRVNRM